MNSKSFHIILLILFIQSCLSGQEIHFSQFTNNPLFVNPANTGVFDGSARIGGSYRSQGRSISVPYNTFSGWGDYRMELNRSGRTVMGTGALLYSDNAGEGSLRTTAGYLDVSLIKSFNRDNSFRAALGFTLGMINKSVDLTKLVFDNQWNGTIFDPDAFSGETLADNSVIKPDFGIGGLICWDVTDRTNAHFGVSLHHINRPNITFYESDNRLEYKFIFHASATVKLNDFMILAPGGYFAMQQFTNELLLGSNIEFVKNDTKFITGLWYRHERDIIPHLGFFVNDFLAEISYDVNISKLHIASNYRGGIEISIIKYLNLNKRTPGCNAF